MKCLTFAVTAMTLLFVRLPNCVKGDVFLDFNAPVPGTLPDANGLGTGFTDRLPLTGTVYGNDPNLNLLPAQGSLTITSAIADTGGPQNLNQMETFGVLLNNIGSTDFSVSARFNGIGVKTSQLQLYVGVDGNNFFRAGFHDDNRTNTSVLFYGVVNGVQYPYFAVVPTGVLPGDDATLTVARAGGLWTLSWQSLTHPVAGGTSPPVDAMIPNINADPSLYTGIYYNTPPTRSAPPEATGLDWFAVHTVPEPASIVTWGMGLLLFALCRSKSFRRAAK